MKIIVQKFGGTSVKDEASRKEAQKHIVAAIKDGYKVITVVSAIGRKGDPYATDSLLSLVGAQQTHLDKKELDSLVAVGETISAAVFTEMLLNSGIKATSMTGRQAGIITNDDFGDAKVIKVETTPIATTFETKDVIVVTGFQGATKTGDVTTLGRGGSDTSAALLGAAFQADFIDIFTDVSGMMTADPRLVEKAEFIHDISYQEVANLAQNGAKVIHPRAVEIAMQANVPLRIRSTTDSVEQSGTLICSKRLETSHYRLVTGITQVEHLTQFTVEAKGERQVELLDLLSNNQVSIDFINITTNEVIFNLVEQSSELTKEILVSHNYQYTVLEHCAKLSVVGAGIAGVPGVVHKIVASLNQVDIPVYQAADSHTTIWILIAEKDLKLAINSLHMRFFNQSEKV